MQNAIILAKICAPYVPAWQVDVGRKNVKFSKMFEVCVPHLESSGMLVGSLCGLKNDVECHHYRHHPCSQKEDPRRVLRTPSCQAHAVPALTGAASWPGVLA